MADRQPLLALLAGRRSGTPTHRRVARRAWRLSGLPLVLFAVAPGLASDWALTEAEVRLDFPHDRLDGYRLEVGPRARASSPTDVTVELSSLPSDRWHLIAQGNSYSNLGDGALPLRGRIELSSESGRIELIDPLLRPSLDGQSIELSSFGGPALLRADNPHVELRGEENRALFRHADLRITEEAANRLGIPRHAGVAIGILSLQATRAIPVSSVGSLVRTESPAGSLGEDPCDSPDFSLPIDVVVTDISTVGQLWRGEGLVALAPAVALRNDSEGFVPWAEPFLGEHPYLTWSLYRLRDGQLEQLGVSPIKHAFFSVNSSCDCRGGIVLGPGCGDVYSESTNDNRTYLGPRDELDPATGLWSDCGSHFDTDGDCVRDHASTGHEDTDHRLVVAEFELDDPTSRYFVEAGYLVPGDQVPNDNTGYTEVRPELTPNGWLFEVVGETETGRVLDSWVAPGTSTDRQMHTEAGDAAGSIRLAVVVVQVGDDYVYQYELLSLDRTSPIESFSILGLGWLPAADAGFRDLDSDPSNDWPTSSGWRYRWDAPTTAPNALEWGLQYGFTVRTATPPRLGQALVQSADGTRIVVETLAPSRPGQVGRASDRASER